jgi:hypothetical protein
LSNSWHNNFVGGYDKQIEDRALISRRVSTIDIKKVQIPISAGLDPFTNGNKLSYSTLHFTDNLTKL